MNKYSNQQIAHAFQSVSSSPKALADSIDYALNEVIKQLSRSSNEALNRRSDEIEKFLYTFGKLSDLKESLSLDHYDTSDLLALFDKPNYHPADISNYLGFLAKMLMRCFQISFANMYDTRIQKVFECHSNLVGLRDALLTVGVANTPGADQLN